MRECEQTPGLSILDHGLQVAQRFKDLVAGQTAGWRFPGWCISHRETLLALCPPAETMETYHIYHDCGKPSCLTIDEDGRRHFPDHAEASAHTWTENGGDDLTASLIRHDMDMHLLKPSDAETYPHLDLAPALLLTALCEIHANAEMFGGIESTSFKIKWKRLDKLGNRLLPLILDKE
jgi:hypothetical protein